MKYFLIFVLIINSYSYSQVGIGTNNPQAQLEVANGNVRFSSYGSGALLSANGTYLLGVDANGDIVEIENLDELQSDRGLSYSVWNFPSPIVPNTNSVRALGIPTATGFWNQNLNNTARAALAPAADGYLIRFVGALNVQNTGNFTLECESDDGSRIYIDDVLLVNNWNGIRGTPMTGTVTLAKGRHKIEFWYFEFNQGQFMRYRWLANPDGYINPSVISALDFFVE